MKRFLIVLLLVFSSAAFSNPLQAGEKQDMSLKLIRLSGEMANLYYRMVEASKVWTDNGFGSGGSKEIVQGDLTESALGVVISPNDLALIITVINNFEKFMTNQAPTTNAYLDYINMVRSKSW